MADIYVTFIHPEDLRIIAVTLDDLITASEAISELLAAGFVTPYQSGYELIVRGNSIGGNQTLAAAGVINGSKIHVLPVTEAGGPLTPGRNKSDGRAVGKKKFKNVRIAELQESPQAIALLVHDFNELQVRFDGLEKELTEESAKSQSRFTATLLLLVSQVVLSIGANLLTSNMPIAIPVLIAGSCQVALALYLTFRKSLR